ncbi:helix-turn-helix transcriptional regulator [Propionispora vibrioides]|jgi:AraC family multidrug resistance transcriptional activator|uniref:AraC-type DNA-binding protein n=1 Tax=Propionispora vibrioides TaxID=112903 RepID=A0A1H8VGP1_9FIRM|nr:AraC family transcriptional regulator [Propionispora vibrioides]SEP14387.1 AraC-type DNA-binding protein [Propionispora vibrioides]
MSAQTIEVMAKWVENNITEQPTLAAMASHVGYSPYYCSVKFREHIGTTYKQFLSKCRLMAAAQDLKITEDSVTEIAFRYGYGSSEALTRAFAQEFHCPPRQYRKDFRNSLNMTD